MSGRLVLCGTPIGNLEDMSPRAVRMLRTADVIACEDTRRTRKLLSHHGIPAPDLVVFSDVTERRKTPVLLEAVRSGRIVVLVSDAGMPGLSDPGYRLVAGCVDSGIDVEVVPGPSAVVTALALSGLPAGRFAFEGFLPRRQGERRRRLAELREEQRTLVFYESPHRIQDSLADMGDLLGDRAAVLARELTKVHEEVRRGGLVELAEGARRDPPRGEIVVVVAGATGVHRPPVDPAELARRAHDLMERGMDRKEAMATVATDAGVSRREVFDALVAERGRDVPSG